MTEKEKMLNGDFYNSRDSELIEIYHQTRKLLLEFNQLNSRNLERRKLILNELFGEINEGVWIEAPFFCDYGENIFIGENTFLNFNCTFLDSNKISIGKNCLLAPNVQIYTATHPLKASERIIQNNQKKNQAPYLTSSKPVNIGDNVWIGGNVVILPGVTIGDGTTIGAGSVVAKDIPRNVLAVGNPCKVVREIR